MEKLNFSYNWNNKLDCKSFTALRLKNDRKYIIGSEMEVYLNADFKGIFRIITAKHLKIFEINEFIARLDTGYDRNECIKTIQTIYKNKSIDWNKQELSLILLVKIK